MNKATQRILKTFRIRQDRKKASKDDAMLKIYDKEIKKQNKTLCSLYDYSFLVGKETAVLPGVKKNILAVNESIRSHERSSDWVQKLFNKQYIRDKAFKEKLIKTKSLIVKKAKQQEESFLNKMNLQKVFQGVGNE